jgi:aminoglycoside phosphotransferase (APT) family kinase protein
LENSYPPPEETLTWVLESSGPESRIVSVRPLPGGTWHANHAIDVVDGKGRLQRLVLRRWARPGWERTDPDLTADREARILELLAGTPVPAPRLVAADPMGEACDVPALLITRLAGGPPGRPGDMASLLEELASVIPRIHAVDGRAESVVPGYRRYYEPEQVVPPSWVRRRDAWERAIDVVGRPAPVGPACFIHRDFHPGNTLWSRGQLTGVVDWTQASWGPPSIDLGHARWNLALHHGPDAADLFLDAYRKLPADVFDHHPYWDLVTLLDFVADVKPNSPLPENDILRLEEYLPDVLAKLS